MEYWMSRTAEELRKWIEAINEERKERLENMKSARRK